MAYVAVVNLKFVIDQLSTHFGPTFSPPSLKLLEFTLKEVKSFQNFLEGSDGSSRKMMNASLRRLIESISEFTKLLNSNLSHQYQSQFEIGSGLLMSLEVGSLEEEFHAIFGMMNKIKEERFNGDAGAGAGGNTSKRVGLSDVYNKFKQDIMFDLTEDEIFFSIVGMAGIGKTNLAEAIFEDLDMAEWFECRVWVSVGKACRLEEIPRRILAQLDPESSGKLAEEDEDVRPYIKEILKGRTCLIV